jgi:hypothetical protein
MAASCPICSHVGEIAVRITSAASSNSRAQQQPDTESQPDLLALPRSATPFGRVHNRAVSRFQRAASHNQDGRAFDTQSDRSSDRLKQLFHSFKSEPAWISLLRVCHHLVYKRRTLVIGTVISAAAVIDH